MSRQPRSRRRSGVCVRLTSRDEALLRALCRFRLARTSDLLRFAFAGVHRVTGSCRLRKLFDGQFLEVRTGDRSEENRYALAAAGREWAKAQGLSVGRAPSGDAEHHLAVVRSWVTLALGMGTDSGFRLERFVPDWEIRERARPGHRSVVPDALVQLGGVGERPIRFALEIDLGSERISQLRSKLASYAALPDGAGSLGSWMDVGLVLALPGASQARRRAIAELLAEHWSSWWVIWLDLRDAAELLSQLGRAPVTSSLNDTRGMNAATADQTSTEAAAEGMPSPSILAAAENGPDEQAS